MTLESNVNSKVQYGCCVSLLSYIFSGIQFEMLGITDFFFKALRNYAYFAVYTQLFEEIFHLDTDLFKQVAQWAMIAHHGASIMFGDTII